MQTIRQAASADADAVARIWNEGIADRIATFEVAPRVATQVATLLAERPCVVLERGGALVGFAIATAYSPRPCYAGVGEVSVYVERAARRTGAGRPLLEALAAECRARGFHKLTGKLLADNAASRALVLRCGFREVGVHLRHGQLDGHWRDVLVVERLL